MNQPTTASFALTSVSKISVSKNFHCIFALMHGYFSPIWEVGIIGMLPIVLQLMFMTISMIEMTVITSQMVKKTKKNPCLWHEIGLQNCQPLIFKRELQLNRIQGCIGASNLLSLSWIGLGYTFVQQFFSLIWPKTRVLSKKRQWQKI